MDAIDLKICAALATNARMTFSELAETIGLSGPSTAERVRKLEERSVIVGYETRFDPEALGVGLTALIAVTLSGPEYRAGFLEALETMPAIVECHHVAGEDDFLLKAQVDGTRGLEALITEGLKTLPGLARTRTTVVLSTPIARPLVSSSPAE